MGITISHTLFSPLSMVSTTIGFVSFAFTLGTFFKVFWSNLGTFGAAPQEIQDYLSSLKQGLLQERRHLRRVRQRLKSIHRDKSHGPDARSGSDDPDGNYGYKRRSRGQNSGRRKGPGTMHFDRDIQSMRSTGESEALQVMRVTIRDLINTFRQIEYPFLKAEYQNQASAQGSNTSHPYGPEKSPHYSEDGASDLHATNRLGYEYKKCGFKERWLWVRRKASVINLSEVLNRVEVRRTAHEVGEVLSIVSNIGRDLEDMQDTMYALEGRLNRVVGVRRVE
ncbi:hypothetical protein BU25DRAFT_351066 [Macroventuria anomochaeta]|uniref:Uncharacterized protein n=1 Tax=Macroventuria anomochaeta TaxID=301207 RepID=A0ACB6RP83_9PLEO|nr:uncharacterized protein BU25DRAFT_351066 [Macroventuria anomochaeta]KAF2622943.1 hypothetical protein BU25DRAFT_351066 [Macroventuria anomochaeta]